MADIKTTPPPYKIQITANSFLERFAKPDASPIFTPNTSTDAKIPTCHNTLIISISISPFKLNLKFYNLILL